MMRTWNLFDIWYSTLTFHQYRMKRFVNTIDSTAPATPGRINVVLATTTTCQDLSSEVIKMALLNQDSVPEVFLFCSWLLALSLCVSDLILAKKALSLSSLYFMHIFLTF